eukprot:Sspe_Gene.101239::Locus_75835_Transcript_2_4_Confidence_0.400_Length_964::g.101239::m.101239
MMGAEGENGGPPPSRGGLCFREAPGVVPIICSFAPFFTLRACTTVSKSWVQPATDEMKARTKHMYSFATDCEMDGDSLVHWRVFDSGESMSVHNDPVPHFRMVKKKGLLPRSDFFALDRLGHLDAVRIHIVMKPVDGVTYIMLQRLISGFPGKEGFGVSVEGKDGVVTSVSPVIMAEDFTPKRLAVETVVDSENPHVLVELLYDFATLQASVKGVSGVEAPFWEVGDAWSPSPKYGALYRRGVSVRQGLPKIDHPVSLLLHTEGEVVVSSVEILGAVTGKPPPPPVKEDKKKKDDGGKGGKKGGKGGKG